MFSIFFFQAEDGIRDYKVTGVRTCALPISVALSAGVQRMVRSDVGAAGVMFTMDTESGFADAVFITSSYGLEIGRASCRERVEVGEGDGILVGKDVRLLRHDVLQCRIGSH